MADSSTVTVTMADAQEQKAPLLENEVDNPKQDVAEELPVPRRGPNLLATIPSTILVVGAFFCLAAGLLTEVNVAYVIDLAVNGQ